MKNADTVISFLEREKGPKSLEMLNLTLFERSERGISIYDISKQDKLLSVSTLKNLKLVERLKKREIIKLKPSDIEDLIIEKNSMRTKKIDREKNIEIIYERFGLDQDFRIGVKEIKGKEYFPEFKDFLLSDEKIKAVIY